MRHLFHNRSDAGYSLAHCLDTRPFTPSDPIYAMGISAGGIIVAKNVANAVGDSTNLNYVDTLVSLNIVRLAKIRDRNVLLVDDCLDVAWRALKAIRLLRHYSPKLVLFAAPVADIAAFQQIRPLVDDVICGYIPHPFGNVTNWYDDLTIGNFDIEKESA